MTDFMEEIVDGVSGPHIYCECHGLLRLYVEIACAFVKRAHGMFEHLCEFFRYEFSELVRKRAYAMSFFHSIVWWTLVHDVGAEARRNFEDGPDCYIEHDGGVESLAVVV